MNKDFRIGLAALAALILGGWLITEPFEDRFAARAEAKRVRHLVPIEAGQAVTVLFDRCPFDDAGWLETGDPMGGLACGETYVTTYDKDAGTWTASGLNEMATAQTGTRRMREFTGPAPGPMRGDVYIWGVRYGVSDDGLVSWYGLDGQSPEVVGRYSVAAP